jgi:hypothetical protein
MSTLRWIAVLPAAIGAYLGIQVVVAIGNSFGPGPESLINLWCEFINSVAGPYCFVLAGAKTAPSHRFITAVVLTVLFSVANGVLLTLVLTSQRQFSTPLWWFVTSLIIGLVAAIIACVQLHHQEPGPSGAASDESKIQEIIADGPERIGATIDAFCEDPNRTHFAQALLDAALEPYFLLQLAMFANKKVNAHVTIKKWRDAGLKLPAEGTPEFFPYGD